MIDISLENNPELYWDYAKGLEFLSEIKDEDYEYPEHTTLFHIYTEIKSDKELECIKSFLATQNLEKTKLIVWSDYDINDNPLIQPYREYLDLRVWRPGVEAHGTPLQNMKHVLARDSKHWLQSDLLRILVLYKYGGVWADMDVVFIRDFKPILDQEYMYQWGGETDIAVEGACASVLAGFKESEFMHRLITGLIQSPVMPATTIWGKQLFAKVWSQWPNFTIFPSTFFNTEWLITKTDRPFRESLLDGFSRITTSKDYLFLDAFAWHWHNTSRKEAVIEEGSKFHQLQQITNTKLRDKGIL